ncbi:hypothetical protein DFH06DRAFT_1373935 [Mycena polygramma]|nr:hypothetical protein DFH06DRAFT_1373935 [Mycena polygramma]
MQQKYTQGKHMRERSTRGARADRSSGEGAEPFYLWMDARRDRLIWCRSSLEDGIFPINSRSTPPLHRRCPAFPNGLGDSDLGTFRLKRKPRIREIGGTHRPKTWNLRGMLTRSQRYGAGRAVIEIGRPALAWVGYEVRCDVACDGGMMAAIVDGGEGEVDRKGCKGRGGEGGEVRGRRKSGAVADSALFARSKQAPAESESCRRAEDNCLIGGLRLRRKVRSGDSADVKFGNHVRRLAHDIPPSGATSTPPPIVKGVPGRDSRTGTWVVGLGREAEKKIWGPLILWLGQGQEWEKMSYAGLELRLLAEKSSARGWLRVDERTRGRDGGFWERRKDVERKDGVSVNGRGSESDTNSVEQAGCARGVLDDRGERVGSEESGVLEKREYVCMEYYKLFLKAIELPHKRAMADHYFPVKAVASASGMRREPGLPRAYGEESSSAIVTARNRWRNDDWPPGVVVVVVVVVQPKMGKMGTESALNTLHDDLSRDPIADVTRRRKSSNTNRWDFLELPCSNFGKTHLGHPIHHVYSSVAREENTGSNREILPPPHTPL